MAGGGAPLRLTTPTLVQPRLGRLQCGALRAAGQGGGKATPCRQTRTETTCTPTLPAGEQQLAEHTGRLHLHITSQHSQEVEAAKELLQAYQEQQQQQQQRQQQHHHSRPQSAGQR